MSEGNVELVRRFYEAYDRRDRDAVASCLHPQVEWHTIAGPVFGVDALYGRADMLTFLFEQIPEELPDFCATLEEVIPVGDEQVLSVAHYVGHGVASGARVEMQTGALYRFDDGTIAWFREFPTRAEALEAAPPPG
jgi:ketosteroid isomerase-like protein